MRPSICERSMIAEYGMSEKFKHMTLTKRGARFLSTDSEPFLMREYAETTQTYIDEEISRIIENRYRIVREKLVGRLDLLKEIAERLLEKEVIEADEFLSMVKN